MCLIFIVLSVALLSHKNVGPVTVLVICFLPPRRMTVTYGRVYLVPLEKLKLLSNVGSFSIVSLCWSLFVFILSVTTWSNIFFLPTSRRLSFLISVSIYGWGGFRIGFITGRVTAIIVALLGRLSPDIIDIFQFTTQKELLGNDIKHSVLITESLHILLKFVIIINLLFHSIRPNT